MQDEINQFAGYFSGEIRKIKVLDNKLYQKVLYITILDALGRARYPKEKNHSDKMKKFIRNYGDWADKDKVSLIQLKLNLETLPEHLNVKSGRLLLFTQNRINSWESGHVYDSNVDPLFDEVSKLIICPEETLAVKKARYSELFYTYRNKLIHEFRKPGYAIEEREDTEAFYHSYINAPWQLGFPVGMFEKLCCACLENLKKYLCENTINPYSLYEFGSMWSERKDFQKV